MWSRPASLKYSHENSVETMAKTCFGQAAGGIVYTCLKFPVVESRGAGSDNFCNFMKRTVWLARPLHSRAPLFIHHMTTSMWWRVVRFKFGEIWWVLLNTDKLNASCVVFQVAADFFHISPRLRAFLNHSQMLWVRTHNQNNVNHAV